MCIAERRKRLQIYQQKQIEEDSKSEREEVTSGRQFDRVDTLPMLQPLSTTGLSRTFWALVQENSVQKHQKLPTRCIASIIQEIESCIWYRSLKSINLKDSSDFGTFERIGPKQSAIRIFTKIKNALFKAGREIYFKKPLTGRMKKRRVQPDESCRVGYHRAVAAPRRSSVLLDLSTCAEERCEPLLALRATD